MEPDMPRLHALMLTVALIAPLATAPRVLAEPAPGGRTARFGVAVLDNGRDRVHLDAAARLPSRLVLLLHGLDESSGIWRDLLPELAAAGHPVALFEYPDDGPIAAAADLLAENLAKLRRRGVRRVDIVAHSMGGLVARDVLARRGLYGGDGAGGGRYPAIDRLVMLGTPNQGAPIARVRQVLALRERVVGAIASRTGGNLDALADGSGEAASDLLPGSRFLTALNRHPKPSHTRFTIVAGRLSPWSDHDVQRCLRRTQRAGAPGWLRRCGRRIAALMNRMIRGFGDGIVPIHSTRWSAVDDFVLVEAGHAGMVARSSRRAQTPPAIPVILDRLATR
jgi:pimeloyl-ACP methyl ester carboxylesterase